MVTCIPYLADSEPILGMKGILGVGGWSLTFFFSFPKSFIEKKREISIHLVLLGSVFLEPETHIGRRIPIIFGQFWKCLSYPFFMCFRSSRFGPYGELQSSSHGHSCITQWLWLHGHNAVHTKVWPTQSWSSSIIQMTMIAKLIQFSPKLERIPTNFVSQWQSETLFFSCIKCRCKTPIT